MLISDLGGFTSNFNKSTPILVRVGLDVIAVCAQLATLLIFPRPGFDSRPSQTKDFKLVVEALLSNA